MYVDLCESDLEVWLGRKLLLSVVIFPTLSVFFSFFFFLFLFLFLKVRKQPKLLGEAHTVHRSVGKRPFLCLATKTPSTVSRSAGLTSSLLW